MTKRTKEVRDIVKVLDDIIKEYKEEHQAQKREWRTYEQRVAERLKTAFKELKPLVHEAASSIHFVSGETRGAKPILNVEQRTLAVLIKHLVGKSNRNMAAMFVVFSLLSNIDVSYKTVERFYSDPEVIAVLYNLHMLILKKKGVKEIDGAGDGTGYSLTIKTHYASATQKLKDKIKDLNTLPFPDWGQIDPRKYKKAPHGALIKYFPVAPIITTRGCPFECTFCASPRLWNRTIRYRSPENVVEEIEFMINNFGIKEIHFEDDNLTLKRGHIKEICELILRKNIKISWACPNGIRADTIDEELLSLMKKSGCYYLAFGFESGNQKILNNVKKRTKLDTLRKAAVLSSKIGIMTQGFFIFGLPGETKETINNTIKFAKSTPLDRAQFLLLDVLPGSELWDKLDFGKKVDWTKESFHEATWIPPSIDKKTLEKAAPAAFKSFFFRPRPMFCLIKYFKLAQLPFIIRRITDFKIFGGN